MVALETVDAGEERLIDAVDEYVLANVDASVGSCDEQPMEMAAIVRVIARVAE